MSERIRAHQISSRTPSGLFSEDGSSRKRNFDPVSVAGAVIVGVVGVGMTVWNRRAGRIDSSQMARIVRFEDRHQKPTAEVNSPNSPKT